MDANELILKAFAGLGFEDCSEGRGNEYLGLRVPGTRDDGETWAYLGAVDADGQPDGFPRSEAGCRIDTVNESGVVTGFALFPDPVSAYVFVRDLSGWFAPLTAAPAVRVPLGWDHV